MLNFLFGSMALTVPKVMLQPHGWVALNVRFTMNRMCANNITHIYVVRTSNNRLMLMGWSLWVTSNNACKASEQLIVLTNGDNKIDLHCCLLPQSEALHTCCSGFPTATVAQRIQAVSIVLREAKPVLALLLSFEHDLVKLSCDKLNTQRQLVGV